MGRLERDFQAWLIKTLRESFPGCVIQKLDTEYQQGIPDLLILWNMRWAVLEVKRSENARHNELQPNQEYFVNLLNDMSFAAFIYPENAEEVLNDLQLAFSSGRSARLSRS